MSETPICQVCNNSITHNVCFCNNIQYYHENIKSILQIQHWIKCIHNNVNKISVNDKIDIIIRNIIKKNDDHNKLFIKCHKILKMYPPAKNEYKFLYGILIQRATIELLNKIFYKCIDLDTLCNIGSEYKIDCRLNITRYLSIDMSIKGKKNKIGSLTIINKLKNNRQYDLSQLVTIIVLLELNDIIILPHSIIPDKYIENNDSNISYKSSFFTYLYKNEEYKKYILHLQENDEYKSFYNHILQHIMPHDIYSECFNKL